MSEVTLQTYKQLAETVPVLFYAVDSRLKYTYINAFFAEVHSISQQHAIGLSIEDVIGTEAFKANLPHYQQVLSGQTVTYQSFFLKKDGNPHHYHAIYTPLNVSGRIQGFTGVVVDITAEKELERMSKTDPLTDLGNRREFEHQLSNLFNAPSTDTHGLMFVDIDFFKDVNDLFGHDIGDQALIGLGNLLGTKTTLPTRSFRIGGEEFAILIPSIGSEQALYEQAEQLRALIEATQLIEQRSITVSIGATTFQSGDNRSDILKRTDIALYKSKTCGRNQVQLLI